jgi:hypothetical protein
MFGVVLAAGLLLVAGKLDVNGIVIAEVRGGEAPVVAGGPSAPSLIGVVTPTVDLRFEGHALQLRLDYSVRVFYLRAEGFPDQGAPLVLHTVGASAKQRLSPRVLVSSLASVSYGAADYTYLPQVLGTTQAALPQVLDILAVTAEAGIQVRLSREWTFLFTLDGSHYGPANGSGSNQPSPVPVSGSPGLAPALTPPFPEQTAVYATPSVIGRVTPRDDITFASAVTYQSISSPQLVTQSGSGPAMFVPGTFEVLTVAPLVGWRRRLSPRDRLRLEAGLVYDYVIASPSVLRPFPVAPTANAAINSFVVNHRYLAVQLGSGLGVDYFVDPVLGTSGPRGTASFGAHLILPPSWILGIEGSFVTSLSPHPLGALSMVDTTGPLPDETAFAVALPVRHRASKNLIVEFGGRWADRAPHWAAPNFAFHQRQLWLYVSLTATSRPVPEFRPIL